LTEFDGPLTDRGVKRRWAGRPASLPPCRPWPEPGSQAHGAGFGDCDDRL